MTAGGRRPEVRGKATLSLQMNAALIEQIRRNFADVAEADQQNTLTKEQLIETAKQREQLGRVLAVIPDTTDRILVRLKQGGKA